MDTDAAQELLAALDAATSLSDLSPLKSVGLQRLSGSRKDVGDVRQRALAGLLPVQEGRRI